MSKCSLARPTVVLAASLLAAVLVAGCDGGSVAGPPRSPHVLLVTLDTTRVDHLSTYGYWRETSPHLDALAAEGTVYTRATATGSWTLPTHASLFTGKFPSSHGARYDPEGPLQLTKAIEGPERWDRYRARGLSPSETTLAAVLRDSGYRTGAVVGGPWMKQVFGLGLGFEHYDDENIESLRGRLAEDVTDAAIAWLDDADDDRPFFLFLNYYDPHSPYGAPESFTNPFLAEAEAAKPGTPQASFAGYDGEIRYADHHFGRLVEALRERGSYDDTLVVVTADHGELFGEHGVHGHGSFVFQEEIHVPLVVKPPAAETPPRSRVAARVSQVDVLPLVLETVGVPLPPGVQGRTDRSEPGGVLAEVYPLEAFNSRGHWRAWFEGNWKLAWSDSGNHLLFDLAWDPRENRNLAEVQPARVASMTAQLEAYLAELPPAPEASGAGIVDEETQRALRELGYVE